MSDTAVRVIYRLQQGGDRLCSALRKIAEYEEDDNEVVAFLGKIARRALRHKAPDDFSQMEAFQQFQAEKSELEDLLADAINSLLYIKEVDPSFSGYGVRSEIIERYRTLRPDDQASQT